MYGACRRLGVVRSVSRGKLFGDSGCNEAEGDSEESVLPRLSSVADFADSPIAEGVDAASA